MTGKRIPPGPAAPYDTNHELIDWLSAQFSRFGDIYSASIYGGTVYVVSAPAYVEHVLLKNWQNYVKGQAIKRIALLLGKGLMVSEGEFWVSQRRMIQPAFHRQAIGALAGMMETVNRGLLARWEEAAREKTPINVTRDLSATVLEPGIARDFRRRLCAGGGAFQYAFRATGTQPGLCGCLSSAGGVRHAVGL